MAMGHAQARDDDRGERGRHRHVRRHDAGDTLMGQYEQQGRHDHQTPADSEESGQETAHEAHRRIDEKEEIHAARYHQMNSSVQPCTAPATRQLHAAAARACDGDPALVLNTELQPVITALSLAPPLYHEAWWCRPHRYSTLIVRRFVGSSLGKVKVRDNSPREISRR